MSLYVQSSLSQSNLGRSQPSRSIDPNRYTRSQTIAPSHRLPITITHRQPLTNKPVRRQIKPIKPSSHLNPFKQSGSTHLFQQTRPQLPLSSQPPLTQTTAQKLITTHPCTHQSTTSTQIAPLQTPNGDEVVLGQGSFGQVKLGYHSKSKSLCAIKQNFYPNYGEYEAKILRILKHPHIVPLLGEQTEKNKQGEVIHQLILPYCVCDTLKLLCRSHFVDPKRWMRAALELSTALDHMHQNGIMHLDLKPENILVTAWGQLMVTDFGMAYQGRTPFSSSHVKRGSGIFRAPESRINHLYGVASDTFALGVVLTVFLDTRLLRTQQPSDAQTQRVKQLIQYRTFNTVYRCYPDNFRPTNASERSAIYPLAHAVAGLLHPNMHQRDTLSTFQNNIHKSWCDQEHQKKHQTIPFETLSPPVRQIMSGRRSISPYHHTSTGQGDRKV